MTFGFKTFVVSGTRPDTEGASKLVQELTGFMVSDLGWVLEDDQSDQAGADHFIVVRSNGEEGTYPTFFMQVSSGTGTSASLNQDVANVAPATAWDSAAHAVPSSGVSALVANSGPMDVDSNGNTQIWISGDSEGVVVITKRESTDTYDSLFFGRANPVLPVDQNPYPLYTAGAAGAAINVTSSQPRGIGGQPPVAFTSIGDLDALVVGLASTNQPYNLGTATSIFAAVPIVLVYNDTTPEPDLKGVMGTARSVWAGAGSSEGMLQASELTASGTFGKQVYKAFTLTSASIIIRTE